MASRQLDESAIFRIASQIDAPEVRADYLQQACGSDTALLARVEALLHVHRHEREFLKSNPNELATTAAAAPLNERPGTTIGRYRLMEQIGEGGMGVVFVAEQQRPLQRKVALKVVKPGMDSKAVLARFEAERQALALMDHPNIARVFDAGTTDAGRPYFVMELVRGVSITDYCDKNKLAIRDRLELFIQVCLAIQHAHQKGVIHRDIKPGNVLVTLHDGKPVPKVIDFGVAKALHQRLTDRTIYTGILQFLGTPRYMSPEQAELSGLDIDTRSDVYSLGVLLYELLTGSTPLEDRKLERAGPDAIRRLIQDLDPPTPSTRISSLGASAAAVSEHRNTDPGKLVQLVRGDLDCIVMKALATDRTRRFDTASSFAADVQRYLNDEPIEARAPSPIYRSTKFVRRHRVPLAMGVPALLALLILITRTETAVAVALTAALAVGMFVALLALRHARREAQRANEASENAANKNAELERALAQLHCQLIETTLLLALQGKSKEFDDCLQRARAAGVPPAWLSTLEGTAYMHSGDPHHGRIYLQKALEVDDDNVAAQAMLAVMYTWNGDWNEWSLLEERLQSVTPRERYYDFDLLCLCYATFYVDHLQAAKQLEVVLERHPTWIVPRALMAAAWGHAAGIHENADYARRALYEIEIPARLSADNPFVLVCAECVYYPAINILKEEMAIWNPLARECAEKLARYPENQVLTNLRALYYLDTGDTANEQLAWADIVDHGCGFMIEEACAAHFRWGTTSALSNPDFRVE